MEDQGFAPSQVRIRIPRGCFRKRRSKKEERLSCFLSLDFLLSGGSKIPKMWSLGTETQPNEVTGGRAEEDSLKDCPFMCVNRRGQSSGRLRRRSSKYQKWWNWSRENGADDKSTRKLFSTFKKNYPYYIGRWRGAGLLERISPLRNMVIPKKGCMGLWLIRREIDCLCAKKKKKQGVGWKSYPEKPSPLKESNKPNRLEAVKA